MAERVRHHTGQVDAFIFIDISVRLAEIRAISANGWRLVIKAPRQVLGKIDRPALPLLDRGRARSRDPAGIVCDLAIVATSMNLSRGKLLTWAWRVSEWARRSYFTTCDEML